jgi:hypothetical protein
MKWQGKSFVCVVGLLIAFRVVMVAVTLDGPSIGTRTVLPGDVRRYHHIAAGRGTPYADFAVEYPPVTLAAIEGLDASTVRATVLRVMWTQLLLDLGIAAIVAWGWGRRPALLYLVLGTAFAWFPFLYLRLDLISVALAVGGLALVRRRRAVAGAGLVAVACFAKIWPIALAPAFVVRRSWRAVATFATVVAMGVAAWVGWGGLAGPVQVLTFRGAKGWQIESTIGAVIHVLSNARPHMERGAVRIGIVPGWARIGLPLVGLLLVAIVWVLVGRLRRLDAGVLDGLGPVAAVSAMLVCATILSPQYVSWLLPFAAIAAASGERAIGWLTGLTALLSALAVAVMTHVAVGNSWALAVVQVRNGVLLALLVTAIVRLVHLARDNAETPSEPRALGRLVTIPRPGRVLVPRADDDHVVAPI